MAFPSMNAQVVSSLEFGAIGGTLDVPWFKVPAIVDVSGMEFSFALGSTEAAASTSTYSVAAEDGGSTGTASSVLFTRLTNSPSTGTAWTAGTARAVVGSSNTDLDADDYVSLSLINANATPSGRLASVAYVYGKPGGIA